MTGASAELDCLFGQDGGPHGGADRPQELLALDRAAAATDNLSGVIKRFHRVLGNQAGTVFRAFGLAPLAGLSPD